MDKKTENKDTICYTSHCMNVSRNVEILRFSKNALFSKHQNVVAISETKKIHMVVVVVVVVFIDQKYENIGNDFWYFWSRSATKISLTSQKMTSEKWLRFATRKYQNLKN